MARKGKKASAGGPSKRDNAGATVEAAKDENRPAKMPFKKPFGQGSAIKKQISGDLGGFIFMCNGATKPDCFKYRVFGLNEGKRNLVEQVRRGMRLFLFDVDLRLLYGIYVASSQGTYKLERDAFGGGFPWQVRFSILKDCLPLSEDIFQAAIKENYMDRRKFKVELTTEQVHRLVKLFRPLPPMGHSPPRPRMPALDLPAVPVMPGGPRFPQVDHYAQDLLLSRGLSPRSKYDSGLVSSDVGRLPPLTKYDTGYTASDRYRTEKQISGHQSLTKYAQLFPSEERRLPEGRASDDLYLGRDLRLQRDVGSLGQGHGLGPLSLSATGADPLRPLADLHQPRARDDILSLYPQGSALSADVDLYRQRLRLPDIRSDLLDRRVSGLDPLVESYTGSLSSDLLRGRAGTDTYASNSSGLLGGTGLLSTPGLLGTPGLGYRGDLLPSQSRYY